MKLKMIINVFGGAGVGKSTVAAELFHTMKVMDFNVELVTEYAKELTYEERFNILEEDQFYIFAKQHRKILRLKDKVDYIVTDSPLLLSLVYSKLNPNNMFDPFIFEKLVKDVNGKYKNFNVLLERNPRYKYKKEGRYQTESEALLLDDTIKPMITKNCSSIINILSNNKAVPKIMKYIRKLTK